MVKGGVKLERSLGQSYQLPLGRKLKEATLAPSKLYASQVASAFPHPPTLLAS